MEIKREENERDIKIVKVPLNATKEVMAQILKEATGSDIITDEMYAALALNEHDDKRIKGLKAIAGKFLDEYIDKNDRESIKKKNEINDVINYLYQTGKKVALLEVTESPDFIVEIEGERIGIEHTGIYNDEVVGQINMFQSILEQCEAILKENNKNINVLLNVFVSPENAHKNRTEIKNACTEYFQSLIDKKAIAKPPYIDKVIIAEHETLQVFLSEDYWVANSNIETIERLISQKEAKVEKYKENSRLEKIHLLMMIDGASAKSNFVIDPAKLPKKKSPFDELIIYNTFEQTILVGKIG